MRNEQGGVLLQVITTAAISLILVSSITLMLRNYTRKSQIDSFIKKRNMVGARLGNALMVPDVLLASADSLPSSASVSSDDHYGNYMLAQCLGLGSRDSDTYENENDASLHTGTNTSVRSGSDLSERGRTCVLAGFDSLDEEDKWYPLLLIGTDHFYDARASSNGCDYEEEESKWDQAPECYLGGQSNGINPSTQVAYSFKGKPGKKNKSHPLVSFVYFRPFCDDDEEEETCYVAKKIHFRYHLDHIWDEEELDDCDETRCERNSPIQLGRYPKQEDFYVELTPADILGNECNPHARVQIAEDGGMECQCIAPYRQALKEKGGELYYKKNHQGPICELIDPLCEDGEELVGQTPDGIPICDRQKEELLTSSGSEEEVYEFTKTFLSLDSPLYSSDSPEFYTEPICSEEISDEEGVCSFYSCRYRDQDGDGLLIPTERVDGWLKDLEVNCHSYLNFVSVNTHDTDPGVSYYEELVWDITETTAAVIIALSETALWIPRLLTEPSDLSSPQSFSMLRRQDLVFPNVGERLTPDTADTTLFGRSNLDIPFCNAKRILGDNAPSGASVQDNPRCPLVVCEYTMTCQYAASNRSY